MAKLEFQGCFAQHFETALLEARGLQRGGIYAFTLRCKVQPVFCLPVVNLRIVMEIEARFSADDATPFMAARGQFNAVFVSENGEAPDSNEIRDPAFQIAISEIRKMFVSATAALNLPELFDFPEVDLEKVTWLEPLRDDK